MPEIHTVVATSAAEAGAEIVAWRQLAARSLEPNVFLTPDFLMPLLRHGGEQTPFNLVFVFDGNTMVGATAFGEPEPLVRMGPAALPTWRHPFFLDATPLLHADRAEVAARALVDWLDDGERAWSLVRWDRVGLESAPWLAIDAAARARGRRWWTRRSFRRPHHRIDGSFDDFLEQLPSKRRGKLRWRMNRLEKEGDLKVKLHRRLEDPELLDRFLDLEAASWKGEAGTALACDHEHRAFFIESCESLATAGDLFFVELTLDGRPAAITANYVANGTVYLFKSAFDPDPKLAKASPGIVNLLHLTRLAHEAEGIDRLDSCANAGSHLEQIWDESFAFGEVLLATRAYTGLAVAAMPAVRSGRARLGRVMGAGQ